MSIAKNKIFIPAIFFVIGALLAGIYVSSQRNARPTPQELQAMMQAATLYPDDFRPLAGFRLTDQNDQAFDNGRLAGRWNLLFFGFTHCPDICPLTLQILRGINDQLAAHAADRNLRVILVSVDPERDTPKRLQSYVSYFHPDFIGITGTHENLQALTRSLGVFYSKVENPEDPQRYQVDHSASLFLIDGNGRIRALFSAPLQAPAIAQDILTLFQYGQ